MALESHVCSHCGKVEWGNGAGNVLAHRPDCLLRREAEAAIRKKRKRKG